MLFGPEATLARDATDPEIGFFQLSTRGLQSGAGYHAGGSDTRLLRVGAVERARGHADVLGEPLDPEVVVEVSFDPLVQAFERPAPGLDLLLQSAAELRLSTGSLRVDDEPARDVQRGGATEILLDDREREVDARGHSRRRPHTPVPDEDRILFDADRGVTSLQLGTVVPVGDGASAVEQSRGGEQERTGASRGDDARCGSSIPQPGDESLILHCREDSATAGNEHDVIRSNANSTERDGTKFDADVGCNRAARTGHEDRLVARRAPSRARVVEDLQWTGDVEQLGARTYDVEDAARSRGWSSRFGRKSGHIDIYAEPGPR